MLYGPYSGIRSISVVVNDGDTEIVVRIGEPVVVNTIGAAVEVFTHESGLNVWESAPRAGNVIASNGGVAIGGNFSGGIICTGNDNRIGGMGKPVQTQKASIIIQAPANTRLTIDRGIDTEFKGTLEEYRCAASKPS